MIPPDISVVMGVRNGAAALPETLSSILCQQGVALELIAVDDGSTDTTAAIVARLYREDIQALNYTFPG